MVDNAFDGRRALREEIQGVRDVIITIGAMVQRSEQKMAEAATEHDALLKLLGFAKGEADRKRRALAKLEEAENAKR